MDQVQKRQIKKYASWISMVLVVALLTAMPLLAKTEPVEDGPQASILSGTVQTGTIGLSLHGGGTLVSPEKTEINLPSGVKLREFLVQNGDYVTEGTPLVQIDRVSVMSTITSVQDTMDHLIEQMQEAEEAEVSDEIIAQAGGLVKQVFAREGEAVADVMLRDGALAVLSLDGMMAVRLEVRSGLRTGEAVDVQFTDGKTVTGRVESSLDGVLIITIEDEGYAIDEPVTILSEGSTIGQGVLYVHNPWNAVAYMGIIDRVLVEPGQTAEPEDVLFELTSAENTPTRDALARQHRKYQELMLRLFRMYQSETIDAPSDGLISGIDTDSVHLLSDQGDGVRLELLVNAPNGDDETFYLNFAGIVTGTDNGNWDLAVELTPLSITDYRDLSGLTLDPAKMTQPVAFVPTMPVYELAEGQWVQISPLAVLPGDLLLLALDTSGNFVWVVRITEENLTPQPPVETEPSVPPTVPDTPVDPTLPVIPPVTEPTIPTIPTAPVDPSDPTLPTDPSDPTMPTLPTIPDSPFPDIQYPDIQIPDDFWGSIGDFGGMGSYGDYGAMTPQEPEFQMHDLEGSTLMTVTAQETMILSITIDEQDISLVSQGQEAQIRVEALPDQVFPARVTSIGRTGTNNGGSSKFTLELTLDKTSSMLPGMSATAVIPLSETEALPVVPVAALVEQGARTILYTGYDEANETLTGPVEVTIGLSDGINAQILSGLAPGDSFWYAYYNIVELSNEVDTQDSLFG